MKVTASRNKREGKFFSRNYYFARYPTRKDRKKDKLVCPCCISKEKQ